MPDSFAHEGVVFAHSDGVDLPRRIGFEWIDGVGQAWLHASLASL